MSGCGDECGVDLAHANRHERHILIIVLLINAGMFVAEFSAGLVSGSTALLADSLDMLADAIIYALGLFALGRAAHWRARAALTSGIFQLLLGVGVAVEALWKTVANGLPDVATMGLFGEGCQHDEQVQLTENRKRRQLLVQMCFRSHPVGE